jgi:hypothetical protein
MKAYADQRPTYEKREAREPRKCRYVMSTYTAYSLFCLWCITEVVVRTSALVWYGTQVITIHHFKHRPIY